MTEEDSDKIKEEILRTLLEYLKTTGKDAMLLHALGKKVLGRKYIYVKGYVQELDNDGFVYLDFKNNRVYLTNKGREIASKAFKENRGSYSLTTVGKWIIVSIVGTIIAGLVVSYITGVWKPSFLP